MLLLNPFGSRCCRHRSRAWWLYQAHLEAQRKEVESCRQRGEASG